MSQFTLNMKFRPKLPPLGCLWMKKMKTTLCVNWAEVIEGHDPFNRATHLGQIKINEHRFNYIRETTLHWQVFVFKFLFCESEKLNIEMADSSRSSSSKRVQDILPSFKPLHVFLISLFLCGILWMKNEATNERC